MIAEVPAGVVTMTVTVPVPRGVVTVIWVLESAVMVPVPVPKRTPVAPASPVPVMVTVVPPAVLPLPGDTPATAGGGAMYVKRSAPVGCEVPAGVVTVTSTVLVPVGVITWVPESAVWPR